MHLTEPHRNTLRSMLEGVSLRKGLQVSIGPIGTGKTTLLYCLQHILAHESQPERPIRSAFIVNPLLAPEELFEALFDEMEISCASNSKPARLRAFHELLLQSQQSNGGVVIIIDEAHLIPQALIEEIRLLLNLDNYSENVLQVILCGQPELAPLLSKPQCAALKARVAVVSRLRPLTLLECRAYIAERLHVAGLRGENPFTAAAMEEIFRRSGGVPRTINLLCDRSMMAAYRRQAHKIGPDLIVDAVEDLALADSLSERSAPFSATQLAAAAGSELEKLNTLSSRDIKLVGSDE
ncbi:MAG TPA: AAA family ATPase [Terriglobales bacterium]|nr:AAA family ATPase [Terriglobales bacterium]